METPATPIPPEEPKVPKKRGRKITDPNDPNKEYVRERVRAYRERQKRNKERRNYLVNDRFSRVKLKVDYKPHDKQIEFGKLLDAGKRIVLFFGGIRSGKTYAGARELLKSIYKRGNTSRGLSWIISPTYPMSQVVEKEFEDACDLGGGQSLILRKYVGNREYLLVPPKGHSKPYRVAIKSAEHPDRLRGASLDYIWMDEAAFMDKETYRISLGRVLDSKGTIFITTTPKGMNWVYEEVFQRIGKDDRIGAVHCVTSANPHLDQVDIEHLRGQYSVQFAKQELGAEFVAFDGLVYNNFDFNKHIINPITNVPDGAEVVCGIDAGFKDPFVCLWVMKYKDRYYIFDEYYATMRTIENHAKSIVGGPFSGHVIRRWMDPSAAQESYDLANLKVNSYPAKNDIRAGINSVARMIELDRLFITRNCINTIKEIGQYQYLQREGKNSGEEPQDVNNHCMDALRYVIYSEEGYRANHPYIITHDSGTMELVGSDPDTNSNKLEDWIKMKGYNEIGQMEVED